MYVYTHNVEGTDYIIATSDVSLDILKDVFKEEYKEDLNLTQGTVYNLDLTEVTDVDLLAKIYEEIKIWSYKMIKLKVYDSVLVNTCLAKYNFALMAYFHTIQYEVTDQVYTPEELYAGLTSTDDATRIEGKEMAAAFVAYYKLQTNIKANIMDVLEKFDSCYVSDVVDFGLLNQGIIDMNDLYVSDPYTFLKTKIYI